MYCWELKQDEAFRAKEAMHEHHQAFREEARQHELVARQAARSEVQAARRQAFASMNAELERDSKLRVKAQLQKRNLEERLRSHEQTWNNRLNELTLENSHDLRAQHASFKSEFSSEYQVSQADNLKRVNDLEVALGNQRRLQEALLRIQSLQADVSNLREKRRSLTVAKNIQAAENSDLKTRLEVLIANPFKVIRET